MFYSENVLLFYIGVANQMNGPKPIWGNTQCLMAEI